MVYSHIFTNLEQDLPTVSNTSPLTMNKRLHTLHHPRHTLIKLRLILPFIFLISLTPVLHTPGLSARNAQAKAFSHNLKKDFYLREARNSKNPDITRVAFYDSLTKNGNADITLGFEQGDLLDNMGQFERARLLYERLGKRISHDSTRLYASYLIRLASAQYYSNRIGEAIENAYNTINLEKPDSLMYLNVEALRLLAHIFGYGTTRQLANSYMERAKEAYDIFAKSDAPKYLKDYTLGNIHYSLSSFALSDKNFPKAFEEIKLSRLLQAGMRPESFIAMNMALIYHQQGELDIAENYYRQVLAEPDYHPDFMNAVLNYAQLLLDKQDFDGASRLLNTYESQLSYLAGTPWEGNLYYVRHQVADSLHTYQESVIYLDRAYSLLDSLSTEQNQLYLQNLADIYEGRDMDTQNRQLKERLSLWQWSFAGTCLFLAICLIASLTLWRRYKSHLKENTRLNKRMAEIEKETRHKAMNAEEKIGERSRQLSAMTMRIKSINAELSSIGEVIDTPSLSREEVSKKIKSSLKKLSAQDNVWEMFRVYFEEVNQRFFDRLYRVAPDLTKSEIRMCAYILAGMTSKEIASLTNRSVRTIDCIKYNLRCKLNIKESTESFVRKLSADSTPGGLTDTSTSADVNSDTDGFQGCSRSV